MTIYDNLSRGRAEEYHLAEGEIRGGCFKLIVGDLRDDKLLDSLLETRM